MDLKNIGRNDLCPCGSGKKFKRCHMGREQELTEKVMSPDPVDAARRITALPPSRSQRAGEMVEGVVLTSPAGRKYGIRIVDLAAYLETNLSGTDGTGESGGLFINPTKTKAKDPENIYLAFSPDVDESTVLHELAHAWDAIEGSGLQPGMARALSMDTGVPVELLEHPQEYGDTLIRMSEEKGVELDAEDEIVAFLARRQLLLPAAAIAKGKKEDLVAMAEKTMRFMMESRDEINARIKKRRGYTGTTAPKKS